MRLQKRFINKVIAGLYESGVLYYEKGTYVMDFELRAEKAFKDGVPVDDFISTTKESLENNKPQRLDATQSIIVAFEYYQCSLSTTEKTVIDIEDVISGVEIKGELFINASTKNDLGDVIEFINIEGTEILTYDCDGTETGVCTFNKDEIISVIKENLGL